MIPVCIMWHGHAICLRDLQFRGSSVVAAARDIQVVDYKYDPQKVEEKEACQGEENLEKKEGAQEEGAAEKGRSKKEGGTEEGQSARKEPERDNDCVRPRGQAGRLGGPNGKLAW